MTHALLIFDCWNIHISSEFRDWLKSTYPKYHFIYIPANCTSALQPADVIINKPFKHHFAGLYAEWGSQQVAIQRNAGIKPESIKFSTDLKTIRPLAVKWCHSAWRGLNDHKKIIRECWDGLGFFKVLDPNFQLEAMKLYSNKKITLEDGAEKEEEEKEVTDEDSDDEKEAEDGDEDETIAVQLAECIKQCSISRGRSSRLQQRSGEMMSRRMAQLEQEDVLNQACFLGQNE
jgi:hypothetical protein